MKEKWQKRALIGCGMVVLVSLLMMRVRSHEPTQNGRPLSAWLHQFSANHFAHPGSAADTESLSAIRAIGTNGLTVLIKLINATDSPVKKRLMTIIPAKWHSGLNLRAADEHRILAAHGFVALGSLAEPALPALIASANHPDRDVRERAVYALGHLGAAGEPAIPHLVRRLQETGPDNHTDVIHGLAMIHLNPGLAVPALCRFLDDSNQQGLWEDAIQALGYYGQDAKAAVPKLTRLLTHSNANIRQAVTNYLPWIDPEAAAQAGIKKSD